VKLGKHGAGKRLAAVAAVALALAGAPAALAQDHGRHDVGASRWNRGPGGWRNEGGGEAPRWGHGGGPPGGPEGAGPPPWSRAGGYGRSAVPHGEAPGGLPRGPRSGEAWDRGRYNGYWAGGRWYYGEPGPPAYEAPGFRPGFTPWRRGAYLPPAYQAFGLEDYDRYHLRRPPYGYHWVRVGDEFLLVSVSTGLIFDAVTGEF